MNAGAFGLRWSGGFGGALALGLRVSGFWGLGFGGLGV